MKTLTNPPKIERNKIGWHALRHKDGGFVGDAAGVICYEDYVVAQAAMTILWQRDGGRTLNYRIAPFTGANVITGEHRPAKSAKQAIKDYEASKRFG